MCGLNSIRARSNGVVTNISVLLTPNTFEIKNIEVYNEWEYLFVA